MINEIPATYMRGGTSKGVFFLERDLPTDIGQRDALLLRVVGSPDPYERQTDGMGGATASTSKVVMVGPSRRDDCDVDYYFGAVSITEPVIDYSGNCGNLMAAVGPFAIASGLVTVTEPLTCVRIWQRNLGQRIDAWVPVSDGRPIESGVFQEDGVPFPSSEVRLELYEPEPGSQALPMLPTGQVSETLSVPGVGEFTTTLINSGKPTTFLIGEELGLCGRETPADVNSNRKLLNRLEQIRAAAAVRMGLAETPELATSQRPDIPKLSWVAPPANYRNSGGRDVLAANIDVLARIMTMGRLHDAYTVTGSVALAAAAALPGSVVNKITRALPGVATRIGHVSGTLSVGAQLTREGEVWRLEKAMLSRSARRLMSGVVHVA
ncbi:MAG: PrpF domain-containing protein [Burkholderiaceae bacterium]